MTPRLTLPRALLAILIVLVSASPLAAAVKRRAVSMPRTFAPAKLNGRVTDASTGVPVVKAQVTAAGQVATTDSDGRFTLEIPSGRSVALSISRSGYETLTTAVSLTGDTAQNFSLIPKPTVSVRLSSGTSYQLDADSLEFGYLAPFIGFVKDSKLNLCKPGGTSFTPDRTEIRRIAPGIQLNDVTCCSRGSVPAIDLELKSGEKTTAALTDACFGYKVDVIGLRHDTAELVNLHFSDIAEVVFP